MLIPGVLCSRQRVSKCKGPETRVDLIYSNNKEANVAGVKWERPNRRHEIRGTGGVKSADSVGPRGSVEELGVPSSEMRSHDRVLNRGLSDII